MLEITERTKKILFAIGFLVISVALGIGLYILFFKPLVSPTPPPGEEVPSGTLPEAGTGTVPTGTVTPEGTGLPTAPTTPSAPGAPEPSDRTRLLRDSVTQAVSLSPDGKGVRFYSPEDGRFYKISADGTVVAMGDKQFFNVQDVDWGNRTDQTILTFPDGNNIYYDFNADRQVTLPKHWDDFTFAPDDQRIVGKSIGLDPSSRFLFVAKTDGNEARAIERLGQNADKVMVSWSPNNQTVGFSQTGDPQPEGGQEVYLIGEHHENFKSLIVPGRGFLPNWSPTGRQILYSVYHERNELKPSLWISGGAGNSIGENRRGLNLETWADKCVWRDEAILYCGVPRSLDIGAGLNRSQFSSVPDDVYQVNGQTGKMVKISAPDQDYPIRKPILSSDKKKLIFTSAATGQLFSYDLP